MVLHAGDYCVDDYVSDNALQQHDLLECCIHEVLLIASDGRGEREGKQMEERRMEKFSLTF